VRKKITFFLRKLSSLILACDLYYPHFPKMLGDSKFNSEKISPKELGLKKKIEEHAKISGVSREDPSLFCLTHIFTCSMNNIKHLLKNPEEDFHYTDHILKSEVFKKKNIQLFVKSCSDVG
jgi:hypothetical protein